MNRFLDIDCDASITGRRNNVFLDQIVPGTYAAKVAAEVAANPSLLVEDIDPPMGREEKSRRSCSSRKLKRRAVLQTAGLTPTFCKRVVCIETGRVFGTRAHAAAFVGRCPQAITEAIWGGCCTGGYHWRYEGQPAVPFKTKRARAIVIGAAEYPSIKHAADALGVRRNIIDHALVKGNLRGQPCSYAGEKVAA